MVVVDICSLKIGDILLRYIEGEVVNDEFCIAKDGQGSSILFLGADLFQGSCIVQNHHYRINQSFLKLGEATRMNFDGVQLAGVKRPSSPLWFYSITGLFNLIFEKSTKYMKKLCLMYLKDMWMKHCDDAPLPPYMRIRCIYEENNLRTNTESVQFSLHYENEIRPLERIKPPSQAIQEIVQPKFDDITDEIENFRAVCQFLIKKHSHQSQNSDFCMFTLIDGLLEKYLQIKYENCETSEPQDNTNSSVQSDMYAKSSAHSKSENESSLSTCDYALCITATWLGKRFSGLKELINKSVDAFKMKHIECIDNLPSPVEIVSELFPQCMIMLICQWMDLQNDQSETGDQPISKKPRVHNDITKQYQFVQLILEFCNSAFVSGVSHVIHAKLLHSYVM